MTCKFSVPRVQYYNYVAPRRVKGGEWVRGGGEGWFTNMTCKCKFPLTIGYAGTGAYISKRGEQKDFPSPEVGFPSL